MLSASGSAASTGLYLSIPFCRSKCTFCNFASGVYPVAQVPRYIERVIADLLAANARTESEGLMPIRRIDTIYFGGGTPSLLEPAQLRAVFAAIHQEFEVLDDAEITLEAAPAFLSDELLATAAELGVTRISFGVQSFIDAETCAVGRLHSAAQALDDAERARRGGLAVSLDLIAGLPGQTAQSWRRSLATLLAAEPEHASVYMLEVDRDSRLGEEMLLGGTRYGATLAPPDEAVADFYLEAVSALAGDGLAQYEISNFARRGHASRHNLRYWQRRPYLGLGLDAHSMLRAGTGEAVRFGETADLDAYLDGPTDSNRQRLTSAEELEEAWFLGLRLNDGVSLEAMRGEFGAETVQACEPILAALVEDGLLTDERSQVFLTSRGRLLSNEVFARFLGASQAVASL